MRYAIYFTPPEDDPLTRAAERWLGRSAFTGAASSRSALPDDLRGHTEYAARYGFHATLKAPFHLKPSETEFRLQAAFDDFCAELDPFDLRLAPGLIDGFLALIPEQRSPSLEALERGVVTAFDRFRAPLTPAESARRKPGSLTPAQRGHLEVFGYPYVLDEFRFHMTLTDRLGDAEAPALSRAAAHWFGPLLEEPVEIATLGLFVEPEPGTPFLVRSLHRIGREPQRKSA